MADHLFRKSWGPRRAIALMLAVLAYLVSTTVDALAATPVPSAAIAVASVPAGAQAAIATAVDEAKAVQAAIPVPGSPAPAAPAPVAPAPVAAAPVAPTPPVSPVRPAQPALSSSAVSKPANVATAVPGVRPPTASAAAGQDAIARVLAPGGGHIRSALGRAAGQHQARRTARRHTARPGRSGATRARLDPVAGVSAASRILVASPAPGAGVPAPVRVHAPESPPRDVAVRPAGRSRRDGRGDGEPVVTAPVVQLPPAPALPPAGAEGASSGGAGTAAGAAAAALLAIFGICILRALLPGLLALGLAPWQSALLVCRLERPG